SCLVDTPPGRSQTCSPRARPEDKSMNPLVVLLMAASTAGADPAPVVQAPITSVPAYSYTEPGQTEESRPRLFGRIRRLFRRNSQPTEQWPATSYPAPSSGVAGSNVWGTMPPAASASPQTTPPGPSPTPVLRPAPAASPPEASPARRLPAGSPF